MRRTLQASSFEPTARNPRFATILVIASLLCNSVASAAFLSQASSRTFQSKVKVSSSFERPLYHHPDSSSQWADGEDRRTQMEFNNLEPLDEPDVRKRRLEEDNRARSQFVAFGDDLWDLRSQIDQISLKLLQAKQEHDKENGLVEFDDDEFIPDDTYDSSMEPAAMAETLRERLRQVERKDPEHVYAVELAAAKEAAARGDEEAAALHNAEAAAARMCLPQFNLDGLWVGKYGSHGYEMINITYAGDILVAYKVTGDKNVPRGEISFQVDLTPCQQLQQGQSNNGDEVPIKTSVPSLQPIMLTDKAARKWGTRQLPRYSGLGQVAEEGFKNNQWMDGQLIIIGDDYFSFAWVPIEQQIFFGRPSPELTLRMLRDNGVAPLRSHSISPEAGSATNEVEPTPLSSLEADLEVQKNIAFRCLELTEDTLDDETDGCSFSQYHYGNCILDEDGDETAFA